MSTQESASLANDALPDGQRILRAIDMGLHGICAERLEVKIAARVAGEGYRLS